MKKLLIIFLLLSSSLSLFAYSDGSLIINVGFEESVTREIDHSLYMLEGNYEKTWFYSDGSFGLSNDVSVNLPISYRLGNDYSKPFDTFNTALSLDYSLKGAFRFKPLMLALGPSIRTNVFFSKEKTIVAEMLLGVENSFILDIPLSSTFGINTGVDFIVDFYRINFIKNGARGFISPRFNASFYLGLSIYYRNGFTFN
ncbi:MAG: hypothetical protein MR687_09985 [Spirochaetales bacterium]|nr:hypothetical protein [Spirochaetales bacterium]